MILNLLQHMAANVINRRAPDFIIGGTENPYLYRWYVMPWSRWCSRWRKLPEKQQNAWMRFVMRWPVAYLHMFLRSDDDRALHDHPWENCSLLLLGEYTEHTINAGGIHCRKVRRAGEMVLRRAPGAHRVELHAGSCVSLFLTGVRRREWGFHCPERGWVHWKEFTAADDPGKIGPGCDA